MGINQNNLEEALKTNNENICCIIDEVLYFNNDEGLLVIRMNSSTEKPIHRKSASLQK